MTEAMQPAWRPTYRGPGDVGVPGQGERFGAQLFYLYRAGRIKLPAVADIYAEATGAVHALTAPMETQFRAAGAMEGSHRALLELRDQLHDVLRETAQRLRDAGDGLVATADAYAATDEEAAARFAAKLDAHADDYREPPPPPPDLPRPGDPLPGRPVTGDDQPRPQ